MSRSCRFVSYRIVSYRIVSYRIVSYRIVSYRIVSYRIVSYRIVSYRIVSYRIVSYRIVSYRIVSHHIIPNGTIAYHVMVANNLMLESTWPITIPLLQWKRASFQTQHVIRRPELAFPLSFQAAGELDWGTAQELELTYHNPETIHSLHIHIMVTQSKLITIIQKPYYSLYIHIMVA